MVIFRLSQPTGVLPHGFWCRVRRHKPLNDPCRHLVRDVFGAMHHQRLGDGGSPKRQIQLGI